MISTTKTVTVFGGSGFLGRYISNRMAQAGWRVLVAVRRPNEALFVRTYGEVGQVEPVLANVRDEESTRRLIAGSDAVVNCVGILQETRRQKFDAVQSEAAERIARIANEEGVKSLVHISAIGADADSESEYAQSKAAGEEAVKKHFPKAVILRPSIIFGTEDNFFNRFASMARLSPIVPIVGENTRFQPVYVDDVAHAVEIALTSDVKAGIYELGGPDIATMRELIEKTNHVVGRDRMIVNIPFAIARINAWWFDFFAKISFGIIPSLLTRDQVKLLQTDNVVSKGVLGFNSLGINPTAMDGKLEEYLYCYRPYGQYTSLTDSAKNLGA